MRPYTIREDVVVVRVVLRGRDSDDVLRERTVRWEPGRKDELIAVIRELAGLGAV